MWEFSTQTEHHRNSSLLSSTCSHPEASYIGNFVSFQFWWRNFLGELIHFKKLKVLTCYNGYFLLQIYRWWAWNVKNSTALYRRQVSVISFYEVIYKMQDFYISMQFRQLSLNFSHLHLAMNKILSTVDSVISCIVYPII